VKARASKGAAAANLALVLASTVFALLMAEALLHVATGRKYLDVDLQLESGELTWKPEQRTRWKRIEWDITYAINPRGFRESEAFKTPPRVLALGDSWTEGYGVEEAQSYPKRLERLLGAGVYNAGLQGRSPSNYIELYEKIFIKEESFKLVTLGFDLSTDIETGPVGASFGGPMRKNWSYWLKRFLCEHSVLYNFVRRPVRLSPRARPLFAALGLIPKEPYSPIATDPANEPHWRRTADLLERFSRELRRRGQTLVVVLIPMKLQVEDDLNAQLIASNAIDPSRAQRFAFNEFMRRYAKARRLQVVDLLPAMRAANAEAPRSLYFRTDGHWTAEGHRVAAETLAREIKSRRLGP
jgi:lysophospholipase L1-like esterase